MWRLIESGRSATSESARKTANGMSENAKRNVGGPTSGASRNASRPTNGARRSVPGVTKSQVAGSPCRRVLDPF